MSAERMTTVVLVLALLVAVVLHFLQLREWAFWVSGCTCAVGIAKLWTSRKND
jgi:hypothetical protein